MLDIVDMIALVLPAITSIEPGPAPLKGTCSTSILVTALKFSMPRCSEPPMPPDAYAISPGFALASAMNSFTVLAGKSGCTASVFGLVTTIATGSMPLSRSYLSVYSAGCTALAIDRIKKR